MFEVAGYKPTSLAVHPWVDRREEGLGQVLAPGATPYLGIDLEFKQNLEPTIVSITTPEKIWSGPWSHGVAEKLRAAFRDGRLEWVAHSGIAADKPVIEQALSIRTPLSAWHCSMNTHYLCNQHLTKAPAKGESEDSGAIGFMDLWSMASLVTDLYNYKDCRGAACDGPCPKHDPVGYCGVDSWAGLVGFLEHKTYMEKYQIPWDLYRESMLVNEICYEMEVQGVRVDMDFVQQANARMDQRKEELFDKDEHGKPVPFNPRSPKAAVEWFKKHGLALRKFDKKSVQKVLETQLRKAGYLSIEEFENETEATPEVLNLLHKAYCYKSEGSGLDKWFGEKYVVEENGGHYVHPRFISVGTSTGRLSSSRPNFQNIAARGWGADVRKAIIPREPDGYDLLKADYSQLELRVVLHYSGVSQEVIGADAFTWLVTQSGGLFDKAAELYGGKPRDIAKRISHAANYLEGLMLFHPDELTSGRRADEIRAGALRPYLRRYMPQLKRDWTFMGKVVAFTGANLAEGLFGEKTMEARRKALEIQEDIYFNKFSMIREWQMACLDDLQDKGHIRSLTGRMLRVFGSDHQDWAKLAVAFKGQGTGADHVRAVMARYKSELGQVPLLQVHDELVWEIPKDWSDKRATDYLRPMVEATSRIPGFTAPIEAKRGPNWKDTRMLGKFFA